MARKSQGFTEQQIAAEFELSKKTVSSYAERSRDRLGCESIQQVIQLFLSLYAPELWDGGVRDTGIDPPG